MLSEEEITVMALLGALESIKSGTTTLVENAPGIGVYAAELAKTGLRWVFAESARDAVVPAGWRPGEDVHAFSPALCEAALQRINDLFATWHQAHNGLITVFPAAALAEASSPELLQAVRAFAEQHDLGYTIHLAQSRLEIESMMRLRGVRPSFFLYAHDFLGPRLFAAHCRYVDAAEVALLGNTRTIITHQAGMAANRAVIPPIPALRAAGCPIAMGTDNNSQDMLEVMRIGLVTERILRDDATQPQPEDILRETTRGGAQALRQQATIGALEVGKKADLIVVDTQRAHLVPTLRIVSAWLHNGQPGDIEAMMVDGKFLMRDRQVLTLDEASLIQEAEKIGRRAWNQLLKRYPSAPFPTRVAPAL
jgi:cytosine/adenosine deaminase-related metal-dependent hydrolase